jgi:hypothetical protein
MWQRIEGEAPHAVRGWIAKSVGHQAMRHLMQDDGK